MDRSKSIYEFKPGDIITRIGKATQTVSVPNLNLGTSVEVVTEIGSGPDIGTPVRFVDCKNAAIYIEVPISFSRIMLRTLPEHIYEDGKWDYFHVPEGYYLDDLLILRKNQA